MHNRQESTVFHNNYEQSEEVELIQRHNQVDGIEVNIGEDEEAVPMDSMIGH